VSVAILGCMLEEVEAEAVCRPFRFNKPGETFGMWLPFSVLERLGRVRTAYSRSPMRERLIAKPKRSPGTLRMQGLYHSVAARAWKRSDNS
jgi:hypothetical protein